MIDYLFIKKSSFSEDDLRKFIESQDQNFKPPISNKIEITKYSKKLFSLAENLISVYNNKLIGVCSFYCQPEKNDYAFLSFLAVNNSLKGKGIAKQMLKRMILFCKESGIKGIKTSTWKGNKAVKLYHDQGFVELDSENDYRVELILTFS